MLFRACTADDHDRHKVNSDQSEFRQNVHPGEAVKAKKKKKISSARGAVNDRQVKKTVSL